ncbi:thioesterase family protein [Geminicoccus roseus]|uniref:thioesterase family protein n=1 Tax=Geminicoccus roseus TaxID=404900 RepID=UPI0003FC2A6C|nr:thioesterase family protein [Geminicoccus roseus]
MRQDQLEPIHRAVILPEWLDYNGHLNEAYYVLVFSHATDRLIDLIGMDDTWRRAHDMTVYTLESHIRYLEEVGVGVEVTVGCRPIELDAKRLRLFHTMQRADNQRVLATAEMLLVNIDSLGPRSAPWDSAVRARLDALQEIYAGRPWPEGCGRSISLHRPRNSRAEVETEIG